MLELILGTEAVDDRPSDRVEMPHPEALLKRYGLAMGVVFLIFQELSQIQASNFIFQNLTLLLAGAFGSRPELDINWTAKGCIRCYSPLHHLHQRNRP